MYTQHGGSFAELYGEWYWTTGEKQDMGMYSNSAPYIIISSESSDNYSLHLTIGDRFGEDCECEDVITRIALYNNPFVQSK